MRSYTRTHLERAARLAILKGLTDPDPERVIRDTVQTVSEEGDPVFTRWEVLKIATRAVQLYGAAVTPTEAAHRALDEAT